VPAGILAFLAHYVAVAAGAWYAFTDWNGVGGHAKFVGLDNFRQIFSDPTARGAFVHTIELALAFVVAVNVVGILLALALNKALKTRNFIRTLFFMPVVISPLATAYIWQFILGYNGPLNTYLHNIGLGGLAHDWLGTPGLALWSIWLVIVWQFAGLAMIMYLAGLQGIPDELEEAGKVDGATALFRFRKVTLPLLAPATTVAVTYFLITGLRVFDQVIALTYGGPINSTQTLATEVYFETFVSSRFGYGAAFALLMTLLIAIAAFTQLTILRGREARMM
jgi:raffinose/stachyose/melibiose transport system permease protein